MGKRFGQLGFIRGIVYYYLSEHEARPFATAISKGLPNFIPRARHRIMTWLPVFVIGYAVYRYNEYANWLSHRKNPKDYKDEVPPPPPRMCRRVQEPKPFCKKDWVWEEYECAEGEERIPDDDE